MLDKLTSESSVINLGVKITDTGFWPLDAEYWSLDAGKKALPAIVAIGYYSGVGSFCFYIYNRQNTSLIQNQASSIQHQFASPRAYLSY